MLFFGYGKWSNFSIALYDGKGRVGVVLKDCFAVIGWGSGGGKKGFCWI
jgi:hypothetical protein